MLDLYLGFCMAGHLTVGPRVLINGLWWLAEVALCIPSVCKAERSRLLFLLVFCSFDFGDTERGNSFESVDGWKRSPGHFVAGKSSL